ncbi:oxidoreductase NAD-binding domain-containing protein [Poronia punctata]|nr:oxidoreductase NAD-binding domain-containing protein [Poronia punctata]
MAVKSIYISRLPTVIGTLVVAGVGVGIYSRYMMSVAHADNATPPRAFGVGPAFLSLPLHSSDQVNHNTKRLRFILPTEAHVSGLGLTSALLTYSWPKGCMLPCVRPYTPISHSDDPGFLELMVKEYPNGKQSTHLHSLQPGDTLRFVTPIPGYKWTSNKHPEITLIAGGAGITPIFQLIQGILRNPDDRTRMTLVFGVNTEADILLKAEFDDFQYRFPDRFKAIYAISNPLGPTQHAHGHVTKQLLSKVLTATPETKDTKVFVCGPPAMETALVGKGKQQGILGELGYTKDQIHRF